MSEKRMAIAEISFEYLADLLQLPAGCEIEAAFTDPYRLGVLQLRIVGTGWKVPFDGAVIPRTTATIRMELVHGLQPEIRWDLPA